MSLPGGYTRLEYIQSSGTQYIDTGFSIDSTNYSSIQFIIDCEIIGKGSGQSDWLINGSNINSAYFYVGQYQGTYYYGCGGSADINTNVAVVDGRHTFTLDTSAKKFIVSDVLDISATVTRVSATAPILLFGFAYSPVRSFAQKLYEAKIYQESVLQRHFIPCLRKSDQMVGLFDLNTQTFFENSGTGAFIAGPKVVGGGIYVKVNGIWKQVNNVSVNVR